MLNVGPRLLLPAAVIGVCLATLAAPVVAAESDAVTVAPLMYLPAMHVFRRHSVEPEQMLQFYGDVLGFARMPNIGQTARAADGRIGIQATTPRGGHAVHRRRAAGSDRISAGRPLLRG